MCQVMDDLRMDTEEKTRLNDIRNLMETLKLTAEQAMAALKMPENEQEKYMKLI